MTMGNVRLSVVAVFAAIALLIGGCSRAGRVQVPIVGPRLPAEYGTVVEVSNWNGSVTVISDARARGHRVTARVRSTVRRNWNEGDLAAATDIRAVASIDGARI